MWNKAFKREIIINNALLFHEDFHVCEDMCFCIDFLEKTKSVTIISEALYYYETNPESITKRKPYEKWFTVLEAYDYILSKEFVRNNPSFKRFKHYNLRHCLSIWHSIRHNDKYSYFRKVLIDKIRKEDTSFILDRAFKLKHKIVFALIKLHLIN